MTNTESSERLAAKFEAAWSVFAQTCSEFLAPEPTYQAWFAHYLISQFGIDRVAREPIVKKEHFRETAWKARVRGNHVRLDVIVTREPGLQIPHYANRLMPSTDGTGLIILRDLAIISELKIAATQGEGMDHTEVARDVYKLSMLLDEYESLHPGAPTPLAYVCVLDNHPRKTYRWAHLDAQLQATPAHQSVKVLRSVEGMEIRRPIIRSTAPIPVTPAPVDELS